MSRELVRNESGRFIRDDSAIANALIETLGLVKRVACAWELFPDLTPAERREMFDGVYGEISSLIEDVKQIDKRKGATE